MSTKIENDYLCWAPENLIGKMGQKIEARKEKFIQWFRGGNIGNHNITIHKDKT